MGMEMAAMEWRNYRIAGISPWPQGLARIHVKTYIQLCHVASLPALASRFVNMTLPFHAVAPGPRAPAVRGLLGRLPARAPTALMMAET